MNVLSNSKLDFVRNGDVDHIPGTPFELQNDFSVAILGLSKFFREDAAVTAQTMQIGNRPCRIYGEAHAEYLLLQMTGEHELQSMESEVTAIAQSAHHFLFAAIPVESWNDALSPWEAPAVWGSRVSVAMLRTPCAF